MTKLRAISAGVLVLLLVGNWAGCERVQEGKREPLVKWTPAHGGKEEAAAEPEGAENFPAPAAALAGPSQDQGEPQPSPPPLPPLLPPDLPPELAAALLEGGTPPPPVPKVQTLAPPPAAPSPAPPKEIWPPAGPEVFLGLAGLLQAELDSALGFRPNDLLLGKLFENRTYLQLGELDAVREMLKLLLGKLKPEGAGLPVRQFLLQANLKKWWFPSAEKSLGQGINALTDLGGAIRAGRVTQPGDPAAAKEILELCASLITAESTALTGNTISYFSQDNLFFHAQGVSRVAAAVIRDSLSAYDTPLEAKGAKPDLDETLKWLDRISTLNPLLVLHGGLDNFRADHLLLTVFALEKSRAGLLRAAEKLTPTPISPTP